MAAHGLHGHANTSPATLARPQATVASQEFRFTGPTKLHDGELVRFENDGYLYHMIIAIPVASKKNARLLSTFLEAGKEQQGREARPGQPLQWMGTVGHGAMHQQVLNAKPGTYVLACFMGHRRTARAHHARHGAHHQGRQRKDPRVTWPRGPRGPRGRARRQVVRSAAVDRAARRR